MALLATLQKKEKNPIKRKNHSLKINKKLKKYSNPVRYTLKL